jgi:hypothetical protein
MSTVPQSKVREGEGRWSENRLPHDSSHSSTTTLHSPPVFSLEEGNAPKKEKDDPDQWKVTWELNDPENVEFCFNSSIFRLTEQLISLKTGHDHIDGF